MATFVSGLLPLIDAIRTIPDELGLRSYTITVRVRQWSGSMVGDGTKTDTDTRLLTGHGGRPKCRRVEYKETIAAGGKYQEGDFRIGPMTPNYLGGGVAFSAMSPPTQNATEVYYILVGPDSPATGHVCAVVGQEADHALHRYLVVRPTGAVL